MHERHESVFNVICCVALVNSLPYKEVSFGIEEPDSNRVARWNQYLVLIVMTEYLNNVDQRSRGLNFQNLFSTRNSLYMNCMYITRYVLICAPCWQRKSVLASAQPNAVDSTDAGSYCRSTPTNVLSLECFKPISIASAVDFKKHACSISSSWRQGRVFLGWITRTQQECSMSYLGKRILPRMVSFQARYY